MPRSVPEWIGKNDSTPVPARVRARVFASDEGHCRCGCGMKIYPGDAWDTDHKVAIINGGENRESNLRTLLREHHKTKSKEDVAEKSKVARVRKKHWGLAKAKRTIGGRRFDGTPIYPRDR